jgi:hypothetical protein
VHGALRRCRRSRAVRAPCARSAKKTAPCEKLVRKSCRWMRTTDRDWRQAQSRSETVQATTDNGDLTGRAEARCSDIREASPPGRAVMTKCAIVTMQGLTFEVRRDRRRGARPGARMIDNTWSRAWCLAVGPRLDRGVRRRRRHTSSRPQRSTLWQVIGAAHHRAWPSLRHAPSRCLHELPSV